MRAAPRLPSKEIVRKIYVRAVEDEERILAIWPNAREHKKEVTFALGLSAAASEGLRTSGTPDSEINRIRDAHRRILKKEIPGLLNFRPSELIKANLHEAWMPYSGLLLNAASRIAGSDFGMLKPELLKLGFDHHVLAYFRPAQKRKYFLQQTPASIATMIVSRRHARRIGSEEALRTAQKRIYSRVRFKVPKEAP